jgi:hypothetical protein
MTGEPTFARKNMTLQEEQKLQAFLDQLVRSQPVGIDQRAAALISDAAQRQPEAAYLLVQRAMWLQDRVVALQQALEIAQREKDNTPQPSFLSPDAVDSWGNSSHAAPLPAGVGVSHWQGSSASAGSNAFGNAGGQSQAFQPSFQNQPFQPQPQAPGPSSFSNGGGMFGGGMLGTALAAGAGVAAGAVLYEGVERMLHHDRVPESSPTSHNDVQDSGQHTSALADAPGMSPDANTDYTQNASHGFLTDADDASAGQDSWLDDGLDNVV